MYRLYLSIPPLALFASLLAFSPRAEGCAVVIGKGGGGVAIASESALIVYDDKTKTQHFVRRGSFQTKLPYFGFLVPTPSLPELAEAPDEVFRSMDDWSKPEVITKTIKQRGSILPAAGMKRSMMAGSAAPDSVQVVGRAQVAGFQATILKASDAKKLREWLGEHEYDAPPSIDRWLDNYVKAGWYVTAFQMKKPDPDRASNLDSKAVRMSFVTDRPFYPYLEPESAREPGSYTPTRLLRVYYVGSERVEGKLGHPNPEAKGVLPAWPGQAVWSDVLGDDRRSQVVTRLSEKREAGAIAAPDSMRLTIFEDRAAPRPGVGELFFSRAEDQSKLARPPIVNYNYVTIEPHEDPWVIGTVGALGLLALATLGFLVWKIRTARVTP